MTHIKTIMILIVLLTSCSNKYSLNISVEPSTSLIEFNDKTYQGVLNEELPPGEYKVGISNEGYVSEDVTININESSVSKSIHLKKEKYLVSINVIPETSTINFNNEIYSGSFEDEVKPGTYTLTVTNEGFEDKKVPIIVTNKSINLNIDLEEIIQPVSKIEILDSFTIADNLPRIYETKLYNTNYIIGYTEDDTIKLVKYNIKTQELEILKEFNSIQLLRIDDLLDDKLLLAVGGYSDVDYYIFNLHTNEYYEIEGFKQSLAEKFDNTNVKKMIWKDANTFYYAGYFIREYDIKEKTHARIWSQNKYISYIDYIPENGLLIFSYAHNNGSYKTSVYTHFSEIMTLDYQIYRSLGINKKQFIIKVNSDEQYKLINIESGEEKYIQDSNYATIYKMNNVFIGLSTIDEEYRTLTFQ